MWDPEQLQNMSQEELIQIIMDQQQQLIEMAEDGSDISFDEDEELEEKEGDDLKEENLPLEGQLKKKQIHEFLQGIVDHKISTKALVDINLQEDVTMIGRPKVEGSSTKQMRHIFLCSIIGIS